MRAIRWITAATLVASIVIVADAQQPQRGRGGFTGGFGGFGGPLSLLRNKAVAEDLKITEEQVTKMKDFVKDQETKNQETMKSKTEALKDAPMDERFEKMRKIGAEITASTYKALESENILNTVQIKRLKQIEWQVAGARAVNQPEVNDALKLTEDQKTKVKDALPRFGGRQGGGGGGTPPDAEAREKARKEAIEKVQAILTDEQKATWKDLMGAPFDTSKIQPPTFGGGNNPRTKGKAKAKTD